MNGLKVELSGFRSEMKEFKKTVEKRIDTLDNRQMQCQVNPASCAKLLGLLPVLFPASILL